MWVAVVEVHGVESMQVSSCTRPSCSSDLIREEQLHTRRSLKHPCQESFPAFSRCCIVRVPLFGALVHQINTRIMMPKLFLCLIMILKLIMIDLIMIGLIMSTVIMLWPSCCGRQNDSPLRSPTVSSISSTRALVYLSCDFDILIRGSRVERAHGSRVDRVWRALDRVPPTSPTNRCGSHQGADQRALREAPLIPPLWR